MQTLRHAGILLRLVSSGSWSRGWLFIFYSSIFTFRYCLDSIYWQSSRHNNHFRSISDQYYGLLYNTINNCCTSPPIMEGDGATAQDEEPKRPALLLYERLQYRFSDYCRPIAEVCRPADPCDCSQLKAGYLNALIGTGLAAWRSTLPGIRSSMGEIHSNSYTSR